jgi:DHA1 family inner membrane transport protein
MPLLLYLFALTNLVVGTGAFVFTGILVPVSESLQVSVPAAGQVMTAYALASALIAPLLVMATSGWPRKRAILLALTLFALGSAAAALSTSLTMLLLARVVMGAASMFTAVAAGVSVAVVEPAKRGRALSLTFIGMSLAYALGVPLGTWLGFSFGWRMPLWLITGACIAVTLLLAAMLPARIEAPGGSFRGLRDAARQGTVIRVWLRTLLCFVAIHSVFAYAGPVLQAINPLTPTGLSLMLAGFGLAGAAGTVSGGWAADRFGPQRSLRVQLSVLTAMMVLVPLTQGYVALTLAVFVVWAIAGFGMMAPQQVLLASMAPQQAPLLMSLNASMLYMGSALGAITGGAFATLIGFEHLSWVGAPFALLALATLWLDARHSMPRTANEPT